MKRLIKALLTKTWVMAGPAAGDRALRPAHVLHHRVLDAERADEHPRVAHPLPPLG